MDRSLKFFLASTTNKISKNPDPQTGLETEIVERQTHVSKYGKNPDDIISNELYKENVKHVKSAFSRYFVNYLGNSSNNGYNPAVQIPEENDISLSSIINWSQKLPAIRLRPQDFVYLKNFRSYPANRLIVLRRFNNGIGNDLFSSTSMAKSTLVSYIKEDEMPFTIDFNEEWEQVGSDLTFLDLLQDVIGIKFDTIVDSNSAISRFARTPLAQDLFLKLIEKMGITAAKSNNPHYNPFGDPDLIYEASTRKVDGEKLSSGLQSKININFEATYLFQEINGVDAKAAMLDIIGNILEMGTSREVFFLGKDGQEMLQSFMDAGDGKKSLDEVFTKLKDGLTEVFVSIIHKLSYIGNQIVDAAENSESASEVVSSTKDIFLEELESLFYSAFHTRYARYRWKFKGLMGAMAGTNTAPWHVTIGNPKAPWLTCGNMVVKKVELIPNTTLGYNDFFTELTVKIQLESGRSMGSDGLSKIFNNGRGRIYLEQSQLKKILISKDVNIADTNKNKTNLTGNNNQNNDNISNSSNFSGTQFVITPQQIIKSQNGQSTIINNPTGRTDIDPKQYFNDFNLDNDITDTNLPNI